MSVLGMWARKPWWEKALWIALLMVIIIPRVIAAQPFLQNAYRAELDEAYCIKEALAFGTGDLNPHRWGYPTLYPYLLAASYVLTYVAGHLAGAYASLSHFAAQFFIDPRVFMWSGRVISLIAGVWQVLASRTIADRVFGATAGWLAAFGLALSPLHVRLSAAAIPDMLAILFATLAVGALCEVVRRPTLRGYLWAGAFIGLGTGTKYWPVVLALVAVGVHIYLRFRRAGNARPAWWWPFAAALAAAVVFAATSPYLIIDTETGLGHIGARASGYLSGAQQREAFRERLNTALHVVPIMVRDGGMLWVVAVLAGALLTLRYLGPGRTVVLSSALVLVLMFTRSNIAPSDYLAPAFPFLWMLAGYAGQRTAQVAGRSDRYVPAVSLIAAALLILPVVHAARQAITYCQTDTHTLAERLFHEIAQDGDVVFADFRSIHVENSREHALQASRDLQWFDGRPGGLPHRKRIWRQFREYATGPWYTPPDHAYVVLARDVLGLRSLPVYMIPLDDHHPIPLRRFAATGVEYIVFSDMIMQRYVSRSLPLAEFYREVQSEALLVGRVTPEDGVVVGPRIGRSGPSALGVPRMGPAIFIYRVPNAIQGSRPEMLTDPEPRH